MDKLSRILLKKLNTICDGGYKVVDKIELSDNIGVDVGVIEKMLKEFEDLGYIDIKYTDESLVCLCTMTKARFQLEVGADKSAFNKKVLGLLTLTCVLSCVFAFLGGFLAKLILG